MKTLKKISLIILMVITFQLTANAQKDTIDISKKELLMKNLSEGNDQYLVYGSVDGRILFSSIWSRTVKFETFNNKDVINISQSWVGTSKNQNREVYSVSSAENFEPIYHYTKSGKEIVEAFNFAKRRIYGTDTIANNSKRKFNLAISAPSLNWELDMEVFKTLPYAKGKTFVINFYHPGSKIGPQFYDYKVVGEETLKGLNGDIDCWIMKIDFGMTYGKYSAQTFWIDKKTKSTIKMSGVFGKLTRYKIKMGGII